MPNRKARIAQHTLSTTVDHDTGELIERNENTSYYIGKEPPYVKLYLEAILYLQDMPLGYNPVLLEVLRRMPWASDNSSIAINAAIKRQIAAKIGKSPSHISNVITDLVKAKILIRIDTGLYMVNPHLFGKGDWSDISRLRLHVTFDAAGRSFYSEIERSGNVPTKDEADADADRHAVTKHDAHADDQIPGQTSLVDFLTAANE